jgi:hypothetical protein
VNIEQYARKQSRSKNMETSVYQYRHQGGQVAIHWCAWQANRWRQLGAGLFVVDDYGSLAMVQWL